MAFTEPLISPINKRRLFHAFYFSVFPFLYHESSTMSKMGSKRNMEIYHLFPNLISHTVWFFRIFTF